MSNLQRDLLSRLINKDMPHVIIDIIMILIKHRIAPVKSEIKMFLKNIRWRKYEKNLDSYYPCTGCLLRTIEFTEDSDSLEEYLYNNPRENSDDSIDIAEIYQCNDCIGYGYINFTKENSDILSMIIDISIKIFYAICINEAFNAIWFMREIFSNATGKEFANVHCCVWFYSQKNNLADIASPCIYCMHHGKKIRNRLGKTKLISCGRHEDDDSRKYDEGADYVIADILLKYAKDPKYNIYGYTLRELKNVIEYCIISGTFDYLEGQLGMFIDMYCCKDMKFIRGVRNDMLITFYRLPTTDTDKLEKQLTIMYSNGKYIKFLPTIKDVRSFINVKKILIMLALEDCNVAVINALFQATFAILTS